MARTRTRYPTELLVSLSAGSDIPLRRQLESELRQSIQLGRLRPGTALPSTRVLAEQLEVSRGVVVEAYEQLTAEGYLASIARGGTRVAARVRAEATSVAAPPPEREPRIGFYPPRPDLKEFPRRAWLRSVRRTIESAAAQSLDYPDARGVPELRDALAGYLNRVRGTSASPDRIVVCNGHAQAMDLVVQLVKAAGGNRIAVENPGYPPSTAAIRRHGLEPIGIPIDDDGVDVEALMAADVHGAFLTPAHQLPTGVVLSAERRAAVVAWAMETGALILEDDYDAEYRYDRRPIGALQGLAPEHVVFVGTSSKMLAPALRIGWMVLPQRLTEQAAAMKLAVDRGSPSLDQLAFADFLVHGELDRHLRRTRLLYRDRRRALLDALERHAPALVPVGASAGLQVTVWLPPGVSEKVVVERAASRGVRVGAASALFSLDGGSRGGLVFGYAPLRPADIEEGVRLVAEAIADVA